MGSRSAELERLHIRGKQPNAPLRQAYEAEVRALATKAAQMRADGHSVEEIARELHAERRALGIKYKDVTPPEILKKILERNRQMYGDELGPTIGWLRAQGKSWDEIIEERIKTKWTGFQTLGGANDTSVQRRVR